MADIQYQTSGGLLAVHYGDPFHHGGPSRDVIRAIRSLTMTDAGGRRYFRLGINRGWQRLETAGNFILLNAAIDLLAGVKRDR